VSGIRVVSRRVAIAAAGGVSVDGGRPSKRARRADRKRGGARIGSSEPTVRLRHPNPRRGA